MSDLECKRLEKKGWLILGADIDSAAPDARSLHVHGIKPRVQVPAAWMHEERDRRVALW